MINRFQNVPKVPELNKRLLFTLLMLIVYRIGVHIPTPGIDAEALSEYFKMASGTIFGFFNMFSGGALERFSVFALGIMPYISSSIIMQLLTVVSPTLARLQKEGELGKKKITQYTRYGTVVISLIQGFGIAYGLEHTTGPVGQSIVTNPGWSFRILTALTLTSGTAFIMWLGEQMTERGIGNGISMIIFAGIVARMPSALGNTFNLIKTGELNLFLLLALLVFMFFVIAAIIFMETSQRKIPIQYPQRVVGNKIYSNQSTHLPLKVNSAGVIPPIFASSILMFPATVASFIPKETLDKMPFLNAVLQSLGPGNLLYNILFVGLIIFFAYFYTAIVFNPQDVAENLKKYGGYIPGIRPGPKTGEYIDKILGRITLGGAIYVAIICVLPNILISKFNVPFYFGGTALLIVVGVALDTLAQIETFLLARSYEGFSKKGRIRGRR
ncbi:MAG: preprotein translocase subunit SecY [Proteobacteria bacterium]|nr:preprotein translocase subunit SecY [Pseudomonadota bacterium]